MKNNVRQVNQGHPWLVRCLVLTVAFLLMSQADAGETTNLWMAVKTRAQNSGDRKSLWHELKKLSAAELLVCGEQFARAVADKTEQADEAAALITINAILSYHKDKKDYDKTAEAVGLIIGESENSYWVYGAMEWIENNKHYKEISPKGHRAIADGILKSLDTPSRAKDVQYIVLKKTASYDITSNFTEESRAAILAKCRNIANTASDADVRNRAEKTLQHVAQWKKETAEKDKGNR